jgi:hypothetical protein
MGRAYAKATAMLRNVRTSRRAHCDYAEAGVSDHVNNGKNFVFLGDKTWQPGKPPEIQLAISRV